MKRPKLAPKISPDFVRNLEQVFAAAEKVAIVKQVTECRDAKDDKFLELALNGRADVIVSGDTDLLVMLNFRGIPIVDAAAFVRLQVR